MNQIHGHRPAYAILLAIFLAGCASRPASHEQGKPISSASPSPRSTPSPEPMTISERMEQVKALMADTPVTPEELATVREHLTIVAQSKAPGRRRASATLKKLPALEWQMPTGENLHRSKRMCEDLSSAQSTMLVGVLKKVLHDPASLQDFHVEKCAPSGPSGETVVIRVGFRAKNSYGALVFNQEKLLAVSGNFGLEKYQIVVWPD